MTKQIFTDEWAHLAYFSMENSSEMIFWVRQNGSFYYVNPAVIKALGYSRSEMEELRAADILIDYSRESRIELRKEIEEKGKHVVRAHLKKKDGASFPVESVNNAIRIEGELINCAFCRDISRQVLYERKLIVTNNMLLHENEKLKSTYEISDHLNIIGSSKSLVETLCDARAFAESESSILVQGETGVGKESMAGFIHLSSSRKEKKMISVNCATLTENDIKSRLFGHVKGAFTGASTDRVGVFELADQSTLFLDEVGEIPLSVQAMLLRVIETGRFSRMGSNQEISTDVRIISATNRNLKKRAKKKKFRHDLFHRLSTFSLTVPSLRQRKSDIKSLIQYKLSKLNRRHAKNKKMPSKDELALVKAYPFPGNIRELFNIVERAFFTSRGSKLSFRNQIVLEDHDYKSYSGKLMTHEKNEREYILFVLKTCRGKVSGQGGAAEILGLNPNTLNGKMRKLGINKSHL